ncbi:MAG: hypothetical protein ACLPYS_19575 [Vulcanimicrobiaceae bacterium]
MSTPNDRLYTLLPSIVRQRDATAGQPLRALLSVISEQVDLLEANIGQLYDDWFIETCQDWVVPYIGDLVGYEVLHEAGEPSTASTREARSLNRILIPRQDVANTVRARRRKGTLAALLELAWDVGGWRAAAVEFDRLAALTQSLDDLRSARGRTVDLRSQDTLERIGLPGDLAARTVELRGPERRHGAASLPTSGVGIFVPRYRAYSVSQCAAAWAAQAAEHGFTFSPLGNDVRLFAAGPLAVALRRGEVASETQYGEGKSLAIWTRGDQPADELRLIPREKIVPANLSHWRHRTHAGNVAVDPLLGRISFPPDETPANVVVAYHYGFSADTGAGEYEREPVPLPPLPLGAAVDGDTVKFSGACLAGISVELSVDASAVPARYLTAAADTPASVATAFVAAVAALTIPGVSATAAGGTLWVAGADSLAVNFPQRMYSVSAGGSEAHERLSQALVQWRSDAPARAVIQIADSEIYDEDQIDIELLAGQALEIRAASGARPVLRMVEWRAGAPEPLRVGGAADSSLAFDGVLIAGCGIRLSGQVARLVVRRSTLVPGWKHLSQTARRHRVEPSIEVEDTPAAIAIERSIVGPILVRRAEGAPRPTALRISDSIVDAFEHGEAIASPDARVADVELRIERSTVFGRVRAHAVRLVENSIFSAEVTIGDRQHGCFRFSFVPPGSRTPQRYECQPALTAGIVPTFVSTRFDEAGYARLADDAPAEIAQGADDRAEMGAFHDLFRAQREANLRARLAEYVPAGTDFALLFIS